MKLTASILLFLLLLSCSKQDSNSQSADSTLVGGSSLATTEAPRIVVNLTDDEIKKAAWSIFLRLHNTLIYDSLIAYVEEFSVEGNKIHYRLLRHNVDQSGWVRLEELEEEPTITFEEPPASENESDEESEVDNVIVKYGPVSQVWDYRAEIDTFTYDGGYTAYLDAGDANDPKKIARVEFDDVIVHHNFYSRDEASAAFNEQRDVKKQKDENGVSYALVNCGTPLVVEKEYLFLKAKVTDLTDEDLDGIPKDSLTYLRNEIFARHGHTFKTEKMVNYFAKQGWYSPVVSDAAKLLNKFEKRNVEFIKKKEG